MNSLYIVEKDRIFSDHLRETSASSPSKQAKPVSPDRIMQSIAAIDTKLEVRYLL